MISGKGEYDVRNGDLPVMKAREVKEALQGRELELIETVRKAYLAHAAGESSLPHSVFLRFPGDTRNRIIALPAYLGGEFQIAGIKWVSSFPENIDRGLDRASAVLIFNSLATGRPEAVVEGSIISSIRTAASASLAAQSLTIGDHVGEFGIIGCGQINFQTLRFVLAAFPQINRILIYDLSRLHAQRFINLCRGLFNNIEIEAISARDDILRRCSLISIATTAVNPHISDLSLCREGSVILHLSLRDFSPEVILSCDNVVDDIDHVCRENTSLHLTEQLTGNRNFIRCTLADVLLGKSLPRANPQGIVIFSPFGLGILDLAVGSLALKLGHAQGRGIVLENFLPESWSNS